MSLFRLKPRRVFLIQKYSTGRESWRAETVVKLGGRFCVQDSIDYCNILAPGGEVSNDPEKRWEVIDPIPGLTDAPTK